MSLVEVDSMPLREFLEWRMLEAIEPYGEMGDYFRNARTMALMAEMKRDSKRRQNPFTFADFMFEPEPYKTEEELLLEQQMAELAAIGG